MKYTLIVCVSVLAGLSMGQAERLPELKNILVILSDDHALKVTGAYGNDVIRTPNMDRLAREGVTFTSAYCNAPICSASRQSLLTGKYPHATGVNLLFTPFPDEGNLTIAEYLRSQGYRTGLFGKTHWNNWAWASLYAEGMPDHGFDTLVEGGDYQRWLRQNPAPEVPADRDYYERGEITGREAEWMNWRALPHPVHDSHSKGTFLANEAIRFMTESEGRPFFAWLAFHEPHHPYYFPLEFAGKYDPADMPLPEGSPEDDRWIPMRFKGLTDEEKRGIIAAYYSSTEYLDKNIGLVLDALDSAGLADDTLVVYLSDNGYLLNEHKRFEKHTMWEEAIRQPMIVRAGRAFRAGAREDALVEYVDVVPTLLEAMGMNPYESIQGESFADVLRDKKEHFRELAFSTYLQDNLAMVCNKKWKYVFTTGSRDLTIGYATGYGPSGIVHRLYNLEQDPHEHRDVSGHPENASILRELQVAMLQRFMETHPDAGNCPEGLTLTGKLVWFCEPRDVGDDQMLEDRPTRVFESGL